MWKTKSILQSDITDVIWRVYLNFHEIDTNSQSLSQNLVFEDKGFYVKFLYYENLEPYGSLLCY